MGEELRISCAECTRAHGAECADCLVSFLVVREPDDAIIIDAGELRALRLLERAGLVPGIRHTPRAS